MGKYHGGWGFRAYSNVRGVLHHSSRLDIGGLRYPLPSTRRRRELVANKFGSAIRTRCSDLLVDIQIGMIALPVLAANRTCHSARPEG
jgi:hypothetical protein